MQVINDKISKEITDLLSENEEIETFVFNISDFEQKDIPVKFFIAFENLIKK